MFFLDGNRLNFRTNNRPLYRRMLSDSAFRQRLARLFPADSSLYLLFSPGLGYGLSWLLDHELPAGSLLIIFETESALLPFFNADVDAAGAADARAGADPGQTDELKAAIEQQQGRWEELRERLQDKPGIFFCPEGAAQAQLYWLRAQFSWPDPDRDSAAPASVSTPAPPPGTPTIPGHLLNRLRRVRSLRFCGQSTHDDRLTENAIRLIQQNWQNHSTTIFMSHLWIRNALANSLYRHETATRPPALPDVLPRLLGKSVILCGAGVGIEYALDKLGRQRGSMVAAVDTALPILVDMGIRPDIVFMLEGQFVNMDDFICSSAHTLLRDSLLVHDMLAHPPSVRLFPRRTAFVSQFAQTQFLQMLPADLPRLPPLGSVGPLALYILLRYSGADVYHCGFDFAFPPGRTHARSTPAHQRVLRSCDRLTPPAHWSLEVPRHFHSELFGQPALSDAVMAGQAERFAEVIQLMGADRVFPFLPGQVAAELDGAGGVAGVEGDAGAARVAGAEGDAGAARVGGVARDDGAARDDGSRSRKVSPMEVGGSDLTGSEIAAAGLDYRRKLRQHQHELKALRDGIAVLLQKAAPGNPPEGGAASLWEEMLELLEKLDYLWCFLPGQPLPAYSGDFLLSLSKNLNYWLAYLERLMARRQLSPPTGPAEAAPKPAP